jgi:hypothetical protein
MKKVLSIITSLTISVSALSFNIIPGWQLKGTSEDINISIFNNKNIESVWTYDTINKKWKAYFPNKNINLSKYGIEPLTKINAKDGFWINALNNLTLNTIQNITENNSNNKSPFFTNIKVDPNVNITLAPDGLTNTSFKGITIVGKYAYVVSRDGYLLVYDISNLNNLKSSDLLPLKKIKIVKSTNSYDTPTNHVISYKNYLYITGDKLYIVDISIPDNPSIINTVDYSGNWNAPTISKNKMVLTSDSFYSQTRLLDISNPKSPKLLKNFDGISIISGDFIFTIDNEGVIHKFYISDDNKIEEIGTSEKTIDDTPYYIYYYNDKLLVVTDTNIYLFNVYNNKIEFLKKVKTFYPRSCGCKYNLCVIGSEIYDINHFGETSLSFNTSVWCADGFTFQVFINTNGYVFRGAQDNVKVNKIKFGLYQFAVFTSPNLP